MKKEKEKEYSSYHYDAIKEKRLYAMWVSISIFLLIAIMAGLMAVVPVYKVWSQEMRGKAALAEAQHNKQIQIEEARANLESQILNSQAEVERAKGMAQAIEIEDGKLTAQYIHYLWVRNIDKMDGEKIYIPTEANIPILEARGNR